MLMRKTLRLFVETNPELNDFKYDRKELVRALAEHLSFGMSFS